MLMEQRASRSRGFTLTEVAIVLGIVGLILGAIWVAAAAVYNNQRIQTASTQLVQMVGGIRSLFATSSTIPAGTTACQMANAGAIPKDMVVPDGTGACASLTGVWGGAVTINAAAGTNFVITFPLVPREACNALVLRVGGSSHDTGLTTMQGAAAQALTPGVAITPAQAATVCGAAASTNLAFTFQLRT